MSAEYEEFVRRLFEQNQFAIRYDVEAMQVALGQRSLRRVARDTVIIAGTNGKGTTSAALNALAVDAGLSAGLYTSPHLIDFRERVRFNGQPISVDDCARIGRTLFDDYSGRDREPLTPRALSYFEITTLLAAQFFAEKGGLDFAALEIGLGGRLDAVNAFDADACIITGVALDHQEYLGDSVEKIAREKAGVARVGVPIFVHERCGGFDEIAAALRERGVEPTVVSGGATARERNLALAAATFGRLYAKTDHAALIDVAARRMRWPGRQQKTHRSNGAPVWIDGAHNAESMAEHTAWLQREALPPESLTFIVGTSPPREPASLFAPLLPWARRFIATRAHSRGHEPATVAKALHQIGASEVVVADDVSAAFRAAGNEPTVVVGSLYLVGDALAALGYTADTLDVFA